MFENSSCQRPALMVDRILSAAWRFFGRSATQAPHLPRRAWHPAYNVEVPPEKKIALLPSEGQHRKGGNKNYIDCKSSAFVDLIAVPAYDGPSLRIPFKQCVQFSCTRLNDDLTGVAGAECFTAPRNYK